MLRRAILVLFLLNVSAPAYADGMMIQMKPELPHFSVSYHRVNVAIDGQIAKTKIEQEFVNKAASEVKGEYVFPIPEGAAISNFEIVLNGKKIRGDIFKSADARKIYNRIVTQMKNPAILEYTGQNLYKATVYPIPANGRVPLTVEYSEVIPRQGTLIKYRYPLNIERLSAEPLTEVSITTTLTAKVPIKNIYSPSHAIDIIRKGDHEAAVTFKGTNLVPDTDFTLFYSLSPEDLTLDLLTHKEGVEDGFFALFIMPPEAKAGKVIPKDVIFVLDRSGSMSGEKLAQAKAALTNILNNLKEKDRFNIITFDDTVAVFKDQLVTAAPDGVAEAREYIRTITEGGGTNINGALLKAMEVKVDPARPSFVIFLTDGEPTSGITDPAEIVKQVTAANRRERRLFIFGVGYDVNTHLLDKLAAANGGDKEYLTEQKNMERDIANFYKKISTPVLANPALTFSNVTADKIYPEELPDLFSSSQLVLLGRYRGEGASALKLQGEVEGNPKDYTYNLTFPKEDKEAPFLKELWVSRHLGYLLDELRLKGEDPKLVEEVIGLSKKYGVITPYTSFLINPERDERAAREELRTMAAAPASGMGAVAKAQTNQNLQRAAQVQSGQMEVEGKQIGQFVKKILGKIFYFREGTWVDADYEKGKPTRKVKFGSDDYFTLVSADHILARYLSVGNRVILKYQDKYYEVI